jgi:3-phosphoshikimate 1-carboxyvinyltransferase
MIDEYPVLAVAAAAAEGETRMRGLSELRVKESDRLAATAALLAANGVAARIEGDDLVVQGTATQGGGGRIPGGGMVATHMDHRLAMSALVMGLAARAPVAVDDAAFIETSFPGFAALLNLAAGGPAIGPA